MLGWRGASRYYSEGYRQRFALECAAVRRVREQMGLKNLVVMVPFCRTLEEADRVLEAMADSGLVRGEDGIEVYVMAEIPSNVVLADASPSASTASRSAPTISRSSCSASTATTKHSPSSSTRAIPPSGA